MPPSGSPLLSALPLVVLHEAFPQCLIAGVGIRVMDQHQIDVLHAELGKVVLHL
eukprot:COSAG05_NODE_3996_length_1729_cov_1.693252_1_plen_53_part_10